MIRKIKDLETEYNTVKQERNQLESDIKIVVAQLDQQKTKMEDKISKLKIALEN